MAKRCGIRAIALLAVSIIACQSPQANQPSSASSSSIVTQPSHHPEQAQPGLQHQGPTPSPSSNATITLLSGGYPRHPVTLVDEVEPGSSFFQFRERLRQAVHHRDADYIRSIATSSIKLSLGPEPDTLDDLDINNPNAPFWQDMENAIATGCTRYNQSSLEPEGWVCPHVFGASESIDIRNLNLPPDLFVNQLFIVGENVNVRAEARIDSPVIGTLSNEIVLLNRDINSVEDWTRIIMPTGQQGYVDDRYAYEPLGYRASFFRKNGMWQMNVFIAGD
jgi:hypothetical protein